MKWNENSVLQSYYPPCTSSVVASIWPGATTLNRAALPKSTAQRGRALLSRTGFYQQQVNTKMVHSTCSLLLSSPNNKETRSTISLHWLPAKVTLLRIIHLGKWLIFHDPQRSTKKMEITSLYSSAGYSSFLANPVSKGQSFQKAPKIVIFPYFP